MHGTYAPVYLCCAPCMMGRTRPTEVPQARHRDQLDARTSIGPARSAVHPRAHAHALGQSQRAPRARIPQRSRGPPRTAQVRDIDHPRRRQHFTSIAGADALLGGALPQPPGAPTIDKPFIPKRQFARASVGPRLKVLVPRRCGAPGGRLLSDGRAGRLPFATIAAPFAEQAGR